jgi:hypothetical protein
MTGTPTTAQWLDDLTARYGAPRLAPGPVMLRDDGVPYQRECWGWLVSGANYRVSLDAYPNYWMVLAVGERSRANVLVHGKDRPADSLIRGVLVVAGLLPGQDDNLPLSTRTTAPALKRPAGPFESAREASDHPAVRAIYDAMHKSTRRGVGTELKHRLLDGACTAAGVDLGAYDHRIVNWLAQWEPETCLVIAGLIERAAAGCAEGG